MKSKLGATTSWLSLLVSLVMPMHLTAQGHKPPHYTIIDLGTLPGGAFSQAAFVNDEGLVSGLSSAADGTQHAVLWYRGSITDIAIPGLGGNNSGAFGVNIGVNNRGQVEGQAESSTADPNNENFCGYGPVNGTSLECLPFIWQEGVMTQLPTLGGNNGTVGQINNRGEVAGTAENSTLDPECPAGVRANGSGPQVLDFEAVIWGPKQGQIRELPSLPGVTLSEWLFGSTIAARSSARQVDAPIH